MTAGSPRPDGQPGYSLRHRPEEVGVSLDRGGYVDLEALAAGLATQPGWESLAPEAVVVVVLARRAAGAGTVFRRAGSTLFLTDGVPAQFQLLPVPDCRRGASRGTRP
jgi:RNA:NAD 2'-phosphotransferase (TPT1/KptA family)